MYKLHLFAQNVGWKSGVRAAYLKHQGLIEDFLIKNKYT